MLGVGMVLTAFFTKALYQEYCQKRVIRAATELDVEGANTEGRVRPLAARNNRTEMRTMFTVLQLALLENPNLLPEVFAYERDMRNLESTMSATSSERHTDVIQDNEMTSASNKPPNYHDVVNLAECRPLPNDVMVMDVTSAYNDIITDDDDDDVPPPAYDNLSVRNVKTENH